LESEEEFNENDFFKPKNLGIRKEEKKERLLKRYEPIIKNIEEGLAKINSDFRNKNYFDEDFNEEFNEESKRMFIKLFANSYLDFEDDMLVLKKKNQSLIFYDYNRFYIYYEIINKFTNLCKKQDPGSVKYSRRHPSSLKYTGRNLVLQFLYDYFKFNPNSYTNTFENDQ
jgi:hypothetical protein